MQTEQDDVPTGGGEEVECVGLWTQMQREQEDALPEGGERA